MTDILTPIAKKKLDDFFKRLQLDGAESARAEAHGVVRATGGGINGASLAGDVTGALSATVVGRILGRLLATTAPMAGQALVYDGTSWVPTDIGVGGPTTTYTNWALTAQGATATASSTQAPYSADLAIDGDDSTFWADAYGDEVANQWVRIDLGASRTIDYFRIYQFPSDTFGATSCKIQSSTNGTTWTDRHTIPGIFTDTGVVALSSGPISARHWRLYGLTGPPVAYSHQWRVNAIELLESATISPATAGHTIEDEGTPLTQRSNLNFTGAGVTAADSGGKTVVTIPGGSGHVIADEGTPLAAEPTLDFAGAGVTVTDVPGSAKTLVTIPGGGVTDATFVTRTAHAGLSAEVLLSEVYAHELRTRWELISNGDEAFPEILFMGADPLYMEVAQ